MSTNPIPKLLTPAAAAELLGGVTVGTLSVWRCTKKRDLPWVKIGRRVFYEESKVVAYIERSQVVPVLVKD